MSITVTNNRYFSTPANSVMWGGQPSASMSMFLRFEVGPTVSFGSTLMSRSDATGFSHVIGGPNRINFTTNSSLPKALGPNPVDLTQGLVYHVAITHDSLGGGQKLWVNGIAANFVGAPVTDPPQFGTGTVRWGSISGGAANVKITISDLAIWNGYLLTPADISDLRDHAKTPGQIGLSAAWRGWYPMSIPTGKVAGDAPATADAGLHNAIAGFGQDVNLIAGTGSSAYADPLVYSFQAELTRGWVGYSGRQIFFLTNVIGSAAKTMAMSAPISPTMKINGTDVGACVNPWTTGYHYTAGFQTPPGVQIDPGDVVTVSAPGSWLLTSAGLIAGMTDYPVENFTGRSPYGADTAPHTLRPGVNISEIGPSEGAAYALQRNWTKRLGGKGGWSPGTAVISRDGKVTSIPSGGVATYNFNQINSNLMDATAFPTPTGLWAVGWDDFTPATPTTLSLTPQDFGSCKVTYRADLSNPGTTVGGHKVGIVNVYDVQQPSGPVTLTAAMDATTTSMSIAAGSGLTNGMMVKVDSEVVKVTVISGGVTATVVRAQFGTTATAHSAGTTGAIIPSTSACPTVFKIAVSGTTVPSYENVMIYGPGDFTPGIPTVLDFSDPTAISARFADQMKNGCGVMRWMDSSGANFGGNCGVTDPEQLRDVNDFGWGNGTYAQKITPVLSSVRAFDAAVSPYLYCGVWGDPYTAHLGIAITTTPAAGTTDGIMVSDAATAPVLPGQYLVVGSEKMRVLSVSGQAVTVERGAVGTTPATHPTGTITVNFRLATVSLAAFAGVNGQAYEFVFTDAHNVRTGQTISPQSASLDINLTYRLATTLAANIDNAVTTIPLASTAGMIPKLSLKIDSEVMKIVTVPDGTHVTVTRGSAPAAHTNTTQATTYTDLLFLQDGYGLPFRNTANIAMVTGPNTYAITGGYATTPPGGQVTLAVEQFFDQSTVTAEDHFLKAGFPAAFRAKVVASIPGCNMWHNVYMSMNDSCVEAEARIIRDVLPPGRKVYVELANEIWNGYFLVHPYYTNVSRLVYGVTNSTYQAQVVRSGQVHDVFVRVFNEGGRNRGGEVVRLFGTQQGQPSITTGMLNECKARGVPVDAVCPANYTGLDGLPATVAVVNVADDDQVNDMYMADQWYRSTGNVANFTGHNNALASYNAATGRSAYLVAYEGGLSHLVGSTAVNSLQRNRDCHYRPSFYQAEYDFFHWAQSMGFKDICVYNHAYQYNSDTSPGDALWGYFRYVNQDYGYGDGRDGKLDNRLTCATPGRPNTKQAWESLDASKVSVRWQAFMDFLEPQIAPGQADTFDSWYRGARVSTASVAPTGGFDYWYRGVPGVTVSDTEPVTDFLSSLTIPVTLGLSANGVQGVRDSFSSWYRGARVSRLVPQPSGTFDHWYMGSRVTAVVGNDGPDTAFGAAAMGVAFGLSATGVKIPNLTGSATMAMAFDLAATGFGTPVLDGSAVLDVVLDLDALGTVSYSGPATLDVAFGLSAAGIAYPLYEGGADMDLTLGLSAVGIGTPAGSAALDLSFGLTAVGLFSPNLAGSATLDATFGLSAAGIATPVGSSPALMGVAFGLTAVGTIVFASDVTVLGMTTDLVAKGLLPLEFLPGAAAMGSVSTLYCTDEDIAVHCGPDFNALLPASQLLASGTDGVFDPADRWMLLSMTNDMRSQGVGIGNVLYLSAPAESFKAGGHLFGVSGSSDSGVALRRLGMPVGTGMPPAPAGGLAKVTFSCGTFAPQIERKSFEINRRWGIDPLVLGRTPGDVHDLEVLKLTCVLMVLLERYTDETRVGAGDFANKIAMIQNELNDQVDALTLRWNVSIDQPAGSVSSRFNTRIVR